MVRLDLRGRPFRLARLSNKEDQQEEGGLIDWLKASSQLVIPASHFPLFLLVCFRVRPSFLRVLQSCALHDARNRK